MSCERSDALRAVRQLGLVLPGGHVSVTEIVVPPHSAGPPLHTHDFDEAFYMLEGELVFQVDYVLVTKGAGELSFAARNVAHTLANHSDAPTLYVLVCTPAGFERRTIQAEGCSSVPVLKIGVVVTHVRRVTQAP